jgi:crotonobetainyl-CoA:carnitine CoA-transferase CaiB-like acyl-CoA transferase
VAWARKHERVGTPAKLRNAHGAFRPQPEESGPLGEHTDEVLHEIGYDDAAIARLREQRVV